LLANIQPTAAKLILHGKWSSVLYTHLEHQLQLALKNHEVKGADNKATWQDNHDVPTSIYFAAASLQKPSGLLS